MNLHASFMFDVHQVETEYIYYKTALKFEK